jgi:large subunit ribosomal protein L9
VVKVVFPRTSAPSATTRSLLFRRKRFCRFTVAGVEQIDYKEIDTLRDFIGENGKITPGPPDRHARVLPAPADHGHQARALPGAAAVQRPAQGLRSTPCKSFFLKRSASSATWATSSRSRTGYARNFLIPTKQARRATEAAIKEFEGRRADLEKAAARPSWRRRAGAGRAAGRQDRARGAEGRRGRPPVRLGHQCRHRRRPDQDGHGHVKAQVRMPNGPIKTVGEHTVSVAPHTDVVVDVIVHVVAQAD